jgi:hypothetical protein
MSPEEVEAELVKALKERDELEAQCAAMRAEVVRLSDAYEGLAAARSKARAQALEEVAQMAARNWEDGEAKAAAIRALKEKP